MFALAGLALAGTSAPADAALLQDPVGEPSVVVGRALLAADDQPLAGAILYIESSDVTGVADEEGFYGLGPVGPGMYRVALFHPALEELGWTAPPVQLVIVPPGTDVQVDFIVDRAGALVEAGGFGTQDDPFFLDPLTVVGKRSVFERPLEEGARVDYVALEEIQAREGGARHVGDLLRRFPSLRVYEPRPGMVCISTTRRTTNTPNPGSQLGSFDQTGASGVNRGRLCPKMVQVYVDDVAVHRPEEVLATLSPQNLERVEYVNGVAAGARFGTGFAEGVLLVYTRQPTLGKAPKRGNDRLN